MVKEIDIASFTSNPKTGQTAEEVYQEWLIYKEKQLEIQISELDKVKIAQAEQFEYLLELLGGI